MKDITELSNNQLKTYLEEIENNNSKLKKLLNEKLKKIIHLKKEIENNR